MRFVWRSLVLAVPLLCLAVLSASAFEDGITERVSILPDDPPRRRSPQYPAISADGLFVAFHERGNVYVRDRQAGQTELVGPGVLPDISDDGRFVVTPGGGAPVYDRQTSEVTYTAVASDGTPANNSVGSAVISGNGQVVAFSTSASNLVGNDTNHNLDVFVHDLRTGQTERVSVASDGTEATSSSGSPSISYDGNLVAFASGATNLVPSDTNGIADIFVHNRTTKETIRVSVASDGTQANPTEGAVNGSDSPSISGDGRFVAFSSLASNLVPGDTNGLYDLFVHDMVTRETERVSVASDGTEANRIPLESAISGDGRHVVFSSYASNLVPNDTNGHTDVFIHDRQTGRTELVSMSNYTGYAGNAESFQPDVNWDGSCVAFTSHAYNLLPGNEEGVIDVYVRCRVAPTTQLAGFAARNSGNAVALRWQTVREVDLAGFHLYRANNDGEFSRLTDTPIPAQGDTQAGAVYEYIDRPGAGHYIYELRTVEASGQDMVRAQVETEVNNSLLYVPMVKN